MISRRRGIFAYSWIVKFVRPDSGQRVNGSAHKLPYLETIASPTWLLLTAGLAAAICWLLVLSRVEFRHAGAETGVRPTAALRLAVNRQPTTMGSEAVTSTAWRSQGPAAEPVSSGGDELPEYQHLPVITSLDFSSDGKFLAVPGIGEVLLLDAATMNTLQRWPSESPRIEALAFSPDSQRLAVVGGSPAEAGHLEVFEIGHGNRSLFQTITSDVLYGVSWSPDGSKIAFGGTDTSVRALDAKTGEQVLFQNASEDWVRDTVFSIDGSHLVSVGRDMACKLTEVATERFVDNITSITPGILRGGIAAVDRHPVRDEILIGGSDGTPKLYRMHRLTERVIGDDANLIRRFPALPGRIQAVSISPDAQYFAVGSSLDGQGLVRVYAYDFDTELPEEMKAIMAKVVSSRSSQENEKLEAYVTSDVRLIAEIEFPQSGIYALDFMPLPGENQASPRLASASIVVGGGDGMLRRIDVGPDQTSGQTRGQVVQEVPSVPLRPLPKEATGGVKSVTPFAHAVLPVSRDPGATWATVESLEIFPSHLHLDSLTDYVQFVVIAQHADGSSRDVTRDVRFVAPDFVNIDPSGLMQGNAAGEGTVDVIWSGINQPEMIRQLPLMVIDSQQSPQFVKDVQPVLARVGCNAGTCHGSKDGKNGFKLSLRGYDSIYDLRALTDDLASRRVNLASPDLSLMLLKAAGEVEHGGGQIVASDSKYYQLIRSWITAGAKLEASPVRTQRIEIQPQQPVLQREGGVQQMRVVAYFDDGTSRDVTREAFIESGNLEIANVGWLANLGEGGSGGAGLVQAIRRGETPILARYDGAYAATTLTVMGDRSGFAWTEPATNNRIDELVADKWERMKIEPSGLCHDEEFIRRVYLDLIGLPPSAEQTLAFIEDPSDNRIKRDSLVDRLIGSPEFIDHWTNKWADLLQVNSKFLGKEGADAFHAWIRQQVADNTPYDRFVHQIIAANGSNKENPAASYYKVLRQPDLIMENTTHLFLATRFNCNKCHDHPFERWTQDQYFQTAAYFAQVQLTEDPASQGKRIGGTAVEGSQPLFEVIDDSDDGHMIHDRTQEIAEPQFPFALLNRLPPAVLTTSLPSELPNVTPPAKLPDAISTIAVNDIASVPLNRREQFAQWLTSPQNPYFSTSYVNRLWGYLLGTGLIEPLDDLRASNPASNPELLAYLNQEFLDHDFDVRHMLALICKSRTYQLSVQSNRWNVDDAINYSHAQARRLPAEVLFDAMHQVTGTVTQIPGVPPGTRAAQLTDAATKLPSGFLDTLGRSARESSCECERSTDMQLGSVLAMVSGPDQASMISDGENEIAKLASSDLSNADLVDQIYLRILNRHATSTEIDLVLSQFQDVTSDHQHLRDALEARQAWVAEQLPRLEQARATAIGLAQQELDRVIEQLDPDLRQRESAQAAEVLRLETELEKIRQTEETEFLRWRQEQLIDVQWHPIVPSRLQQSSGGALQVRADRSIRALETKGQTETIVETFTNLPLITAVRLEALSDPDLPNAGPGLAANGNFVLSELVIEAASVDQPDAWQTIAIEEAIADFQQEGFPASEVFNGQSDETSDGWAIHPATGRTHWMTLRLAKPIEFPAGCHLRFRLFQNYRGDAIHQLGQFRISLSGHPTPLGLSVAEERLAELASDPAAYSAEQKNSLLEIYRAGDVRRLSLERALADARIAREVHPSILAQRKVLARAQLPIPADGVLQQLSVDVGFSQQQLESIRLTVAQDLTWALLNSPSFLFNR